MSDIENRIAALEREVLKQKYVDQALTLVLAAHVSGRLNVATLHETKERLLSPVYQSPNPNTDAIIEAFDEVIGTFIEVLSARHGSS